MGKWFGSSGVRGSYDVISPEFALKLGMAVGKTFNLKKPVFIASDIRATGDIQKSSFMSGYSSYSGDIIDIGLCPTPVLSYMSDISETLGIMVTASHNPPENNGFKLFWKGGECSEETEKKIEDFMETLEPRTEHVEETSLHWESVGMNTSIESSRIIDHFVNFLVKKITISNINTKIVLDCANNVPNLVSPLSLEKLGLENVILINKDLDSTFPGRLSEPTLDNLQELIQKVISEEADLGVAHDGDGDRFTIIDEKGHLIKATTLINFFIDNLDYSDQSRRIVYLTSDCTSEATITAIKHGAIVKTSRIGRNREHVNEEGVLFLAEPNKLIFPEFGDWIDGLYPVLKLLEIRKNRKISEIMSEYESRKTLRRAYKISEDEKDQIFDHIEKLPILWADLCDKSITLDGLKLFLKDNSCVLIRFSGTEPKVKFYLESDTDDQNLKLISLIQEELNLTGEGVEC
jgi:phosphomannomutase